MYLAPLDRSAVRAGPERSIAVLNSAIVALFAAFVLCSGRVSLTSFVELAASYVGISLIILGLAVMLYAGQVVARSGFASQWTERPTRALVTAFGRRWRDDRMFCLVWPVALFLLLMPTFNAFKQRILPQAGFSYDRDLAEFDRLLFGTDPGVWLHRAIGSPAMTRLFDAAYHSWFVPTTLGLCLVGLCATPRVRCQYVTAYVAVWVVLGGVLAYLFPAAGPAFYRDLVDPTGAAPFVAVQQQLAVAGASGGFLTSIHNQAYLLQNLDSPTLVVGGGVSAIPSVHNAMAVLFAIVSFRLNRILGLAMSAFAAFIWVASVYLNWHYAVDGLAGGLGAIVLWKLSGAIVDRLFRSRLSAEVAAEPVEMPVAA
jgi:hypothetical protein